MLPQTPAVVDEHPVALQTSYLSGPGDASLDARGAAFTTTLGSWLVLTGVDVLDAAPVNADRRDGRLDHGRGGERSDTDTRWSDALSVPPGRSRERGEMAVLNAGISRNELLADRGGEHR